MLSPGGEGGKGHSGCHEARPRTVCSKLIWASGGERVGGNAYAGNGWERADEARSGGDHGKDQGRAGGATEAPIAPTSCASGLAAAAPSTYGAGVYIEYRGLWHGKGGNEDCDHLVLVVDSEAIDVSYSKSIVVFEILLGIYQAQISD